MLGFAGLVLLGIASIYIFSKPIKDKVTQSISSQLAVKVAISDIGLSAFKNFPYITVSFQNIRAAESSKITGSQLMTLQSLSVTLNPLNLLRGQYRFEEIVLQNGKLKAAQDGEKNNFLIFKPDDGKGGGKFKLVFEKITLANIQLQHIDVQKGDTIGVLVNNVQLQGSFDEKEFLVNTKGSIVPQQLKLDGQTLSIAKPVTFQTSFKVNRPDTSYSFTQTKLTVEDFNFIVNGKITTRQKSNHINLQLLGDNLGLLQLLELIPKKYLPNISDYQTDGKLECRVSVLGELGQGKTPAVDATFKIANGRLAKAGFDVQMTDIQLSGKLKYEQQGDFTLSSLEIPQIKASVNGERVQGAVSLLNLSNPIVKAKIEGTFNLKQWAQLFKLEKIETLEGLATLNLEMEGKVSDFNKKTETLPALFQGTLTAKNVKLALKGSPYKYDNVNGHLFADNNLLDIDTLYAQINGNSLGIKGKAHHLLDYMFSTGKTLEVEGHLTSPHIDIPSLAAVGGDKKTEDTLGFTIPDNITFKLKSHIAKLTFNKFLARNVSGTVAAGNKVITLQNLDFDAMGGSFALSGNVFEKAGKQFVISAQLEAQKVDIEQLFYQCNNFGQNHITSENLKGTLTTRLQLAAPLDKYLNIDVSKLFVTSHLSITGGRLYNYAPMLKLSGFVDVNDLKDIAFEKLENNIEIRDNRIIIPQMEIKNSALNLLAEGYHTFENYMEYKFRLKLKDVLSKKFNRKKASAGNYEEDKEGINIFILMKGPADNPTVTYDRKSAFKNVKENIKTEKNTLLQLLRDEFDIQKKDTKDSDGKPQDKNRKNDEEVEEWETDIPR